MFFKDLTSNLFSFNFSLIINCESRITIINKRINKKKRFFDINILL